MSDLTYSKTSLARTFPALASVSAADGAALAAYPASSSSLPPSSRPPPPLRLGASEELCLLLLVQQPSALEGWEQREMDLPFFVPDSRFDAQPSTRMTLASFYPTGVGVPDDLLLRLHASGAEVDLNASLTLLTPPSGAPGGGSGGLQWHATVQKQQPGGVAQFEWHSPPIFTAYAGAVGLEALWRLRRSMAAAKGSAQMEVNLIARVEHTVFSWNSAPRRSLYPCSGSNSNPSCGAFDDVGPFTNARLPVYSPLLLPLVSFVWGGGEGVPTPAPPSPADAPQPCPTGMTGVWALENSAGAVPRSPTGPFWRPTHCNAAPITGKVLSTCIRKRYPYIVLLGDSHIRRHFKEIMGRSSKMADYYAAPFVSGSPPSGEGARVSDVDSKVAAAVMEGTASSWCLSREDQVDCTCSDAIHGPTDPDPNPLTFLYKETMTWFYGSAQEGGGNDGLQQRAEVEMLWWIGFLFPEWKESLLELSVYAHAKSMEVHGAPPSLVVFDMVHWDAAFNTLARFDRELPYLSEALAAAFPPPTLFVYRTPSYFAGDDSWADKNKGRRWYSRAKVEHMHLAVLAELKSGVLKNRLLVWDAYALGAARSLNATIRHLGECLTGHERSEDAGVQNQLLFNMLCTESG